VGAKLLAIASLGAFVAALSTSLVAVSVPVIAHDLRVTPADVSWILSAYLLAVSCLLALAGKATDVFGTKRIYLVGYVLFTLGSALCAVAPLLAALVGARIVQGAGSAMLMAVGPALVTRAVPPERRARGLGIQLAATYFGLTLGPSAGGLLAAEVGWHAVFAVIAAAGVAGFGFAFVFLPPDEPKPRSAIRSLDLVGAALFAASLAGFLVALKRAPERGWTSGATLIGGAIATLALTAFVRHEARQERPVLPLGLFALPAFSLGVAGAVLLYTVTFMLSFLLPVELQHGGGLGPAAAGAFMTAQPATMAVTAPVSGVLADRFGPRFPSAAGMLAIAAGLLALLPAVRHPGTTLVLALALVGLGAGLYVAPNSALIMGAAPKNLQGVAAAMSATARNVGMTLGIAIAASIDRALGFRGAVVVAAVVAVGGAVLAAARPVRS
jgi:EmrB/QacA subfamily drug resistance transporter